MCLAFVAQQALIALPLLAGTVLARGWVWAQAWWHSHSVCHVAYFAEMVARAYDWQN